MFCCCSAPFFSLEINPYECFVNTNGGEVCGSTSSNPYGLRNIRHALLVSTHHQLLQQTWRTVTQPVQDNHGFFISLTLWEDSVTLDRKYLMNRASHKRISIKTAHDRRECLNPTAILIDYNGNAFF